MVRYSKQKPEEADALRAAMAHLSAHMERTSDDRYGGEEATLLNFTQNDMDRFRYFRPTPFTPLTLH